MDQEVAKYKKKAKRKCVVKSNHRHDYTEDVLVRHTGGWGEYHTLAKRCTICSKISLGNLFETEEDENGLSVILSDKALLRKYENTPIIDYKSLKGK